VAAADAALLASGSQCGQATLRPIDYADGANGSANAVAVTGLLVDGQEIHGRSPLVLIDREP
jgi:hypothetical protein